MQQQQQQQQQELDAGDGDALDEQLTDSSRIWSAGVLLELVHIWRRVELAYPALGRVAKAQLVYDEFSEKVDRGGSSNGNEDAGSGDSSNVAKRSRKAVEDKLYTMKQMYRFIIDMNRDFMRQRNARSGMRSWFDLSKQERRAVRSLHGIRIPNISHEVFQVLDSVLHADSADTRPRKKAKTRQSLDAIEFQPLPPPPSQSANDGGGGDDDDDDDEGISQQAFVLDGKRNWSADATMQLAKIWGDIQRAYPSLRGTLLGDQVYTVFKAKAGGSLSRSQKAVEEKMQSMKEMYRFIKSYEDARGAVESDGTGTGGLETRPSWFELTKAEKRQLRKANKIRVTNLSREQFDQVDAIMNVRAEAEAALLEITKQTPPPPPAAPSNNSTSVLQPQQQTQRATNESNGRNSNTSTQSPGVLGAMQRVIAQELRASSSTEQQPAGTQGSPTAATRAQKRPRADGPVPAPYTTQASVQSASRAGVVGVDYATAEYLLEKIRLLREQERTERRRQHEEHMAAIRGLSDLLKNQHQQNQQEPQSSAVAREAGAAEGL